MKKNKIREEKIHIANIKKEQKDPDLLIRN